MFQIRVDPAGGLGILTNAQERQIPFAVALALNLTANDAQGSERYRVESNFKLTRKDFNLKGIYIDNADRARKDSWRVVIQVQASRDYLDKFEAGGYKLPTHGRWIWKPNPKVFGGRVIPDNLRPKALNFQRRGGAMVGNERTFMVKAKNNLPIVLQRVDRGLDKRSIRNMRRMDLDSLKAGMGPQTRAQSRKEKYSLRRNEGTRMLYQLVDRVTVPVKLEFVATVGQAVEASWPGRFQEAMQRAMGSAR